MLQSAVMYYNVLIYGTLVYIFYSKTNLNIAFVDSITIS